MQAFKVNERRYNGVRSFFFENLTDARRFVLDKLQNDGANSDLQAVSTLEPPFYFMTGKRSIELVQTDLTLERQFRTEVQGFLARKLQPYDFELRMELGRRAEIERFTVRDFLLLHDGQPPAWWWWSLLGRYVAQLIVDDEDDRGTFTQRYAAQLLDVHPGTMAKWVARKKFQEIHVNRENKLLRRDVLWVMLMANE